MIKQHKGPLCANSSPKEPCFNVVEQGHIMCNPCRLSQIGYASTVPHVQRKLRKRKPDSRREEKRIA